MLLKVLQVQWSIYLLLTMVAERLIIRDVFSCQEFSVLRVFEEDFETRSGILCICE